MTLPMRWATKDSGASTSGISAITMFVVAGLSPTFSLKKIGKNLHLQVRASLHLSHPDHLSDLSIHLRTRLLVRQAGVWGTR